MSAEDRRLEEHRRGEKNWKLWGPYVCEREWGTIRENYGSDQNYWEHFPHDQARKRAYRWGEDAIAGFSDEKQLVCFAPAFWNGRDPILKERLFGVTSNGNHGPDVKEVYYHLDATPTHSYMRFLYRYPQREYPYALLESENKNRSRTDPEYEIVDTGVFDEQRYWDIDIEYAKADEADILVRITATNRGPEDAVLHMLPTVWFRNTWSWKRDAERPWLKASDGGIELHHAGAGDYRFAVEHAGTLLFTDNETNENELPDLATGGRVFKDAFHRLIVNGDESAVNPDERGTKACAWVKLRVAAGESQTVRARLWRGGERGDAFAGFDEVFNQRRSEAGEFFRHTLGTEKPPPLATLERQAVSSLLWSKQYCYFSAREWLDGDVVNAPAQAGRAELGASWGNLFCDDILITPDNWEYPWWYSWDLAFHTLPMALVDPGEAKQQLLGFLSHRFASADGQVPSNNLRLSEPAPPVHAWAAWRVFDLERRRTGKPDHDFIAAVSDRMLMHLARWGTQLDAGGTHIYTGGFLGMDNIGIIDRRNPPPMGGALEQADATGWAAFLTLSLFRIAVELIPERPSYRDTAVLLLDHFLRIRDALNGPDGLWSEGDCFYFDRVLLPDGRKIPLRCFSMVGLVPMFATEVFEAGDEEGLSAIADDIEWLVRNRPYAAGPLRDFTHPARKRLLCLVPPERMRTVFDRVLDPAQFLSPHGIRSLSRLHAQRPAFVRFEDFEASIRYEPAETTSDIFSGNSNWRGPVWFPVNYLLIRAIASAGRCFGNAFCVDLPSGDGRCVPLDEVARNLAERLIKLFVPGPDGRRPEFKERLLFDTDRHFREYPLFYEYFDGDTGVGLGASSQTGWTALVANLVEEFGA